MEQIKVSNLTFSYDVNSAFSLENVSFSVNRGEVLLIIGESGSGKTTLLRHLKPDYMPEGNRYVDSEIRINGKRIGDLTQRERAGLVGFVRQNADCAQVTDKVWHELAFGLESLGYPQAVMQRKVAEMTAFFGLESIYHKKPEHLSGGQKQLVNLASVMAMEPEVLILDEPTSQLDPVAATEFFRMIEKINREIGTTILMTEHRLEEVFSLCDRVLVMERGKAADAGSPQLAARYLYEKNSPLYSALPTAAKLYFELTGKKKETAAEAVGKTERIPLTVNEGRAWLEALCKEKEQSCSGVLSEEGYSTAGRRNAGHPSVLYADELWFRYEKEGKDVLKACSLRPEQGKITAVLGGNGAGKSTLLHVLAGHLQAYRGKVAGLIQSVGMMPQNPQAMFAEKTVKDELEKCPGDMQAVIDFFDLQEVLLQHPFDLSGGQLQKLALAKLLSEDYDILLLDEPGKGMDYAFKAELGAHLRHLADKGRTILMVSHDVEFCARYADACGLFFDGHIVSLSDTREFFLQNVFYTTAVVRMCRRLLPQAVVMEDVLCAFGVPENRQGNRTEGNGQENYNPFGNGPEKDKRTKNKESKDRNQHRNENNAEFHEDEKKALPQSVAVSPRKYWISLLIFFVLMPLTIYFGHSVLEQRKYYFISLLLVLEAILSFFLSFEKRKPKLREIMVIAMLGAITAAGRAAFYMIPSIKPMAALTIISGAGLGGEAGFLVGAMSMVVSNIFFGQGPWTPWQMFAMGMLGFLAGIVFRQDTPCSGKKKFGISLFGAVSVLIVYGGIMNPASVLIYQEHVNRNMILAAYGMGLPFDAVNAAATFIFLWLGARPMLEKIERIRKKYGFDTVLYK